MRAPDRSSSFKDDINKFLKRYEIKHRDRAFAFLLRLRDDPEQRIDTIWKKIVDDNPSIDTPSERELFLKGLMDPWDTAFLADLAAKVGGITKRGLQDDKTKIKKCLLNLFLRHRPEGF
jgi:hypothetical protein